jgi:hypothetical protein
MSIKSHSLIIFQKEYHGKEHFALIPDLRINRQQQLLLKLADIHNKDPTMISIVGDVWKEFEVELPIDNVVIQHVYNIGLVDI